MIAMPRTGRPFMPVALRRPGSGFRPRERRGGNPPVAHSTGGLPPRRSLARPLVLAALALLAFPLPSRAQPAAPRDELLALVPSDVGFCLLVNDLRGHVRKLGEAPWALSLRHSAPVRAILQSPEAGQLAALEGVLKKLVGVDWPTLRDDVLGDAVVLAYRPGTAAHPEQGMIALHAARPKLLAALVARFDELQKEGGELKAVEPMPYLGTVYQRRVHSERNHFYYLRGPLLIVAGDEAMLRQAIDRDLGRADAASPWPDRFRRAGAGAALLTLAVNPRVVDPFPATAAGETPHGIAGFWHALDAAFLSLATDPAPALRLTLQGRATDMPAWARPPFEQTLTPSVLWQRFPESAALTLAGQIDFAVLADRVLELLPPEPRRQIREALRGGLGPFLRRDVFQEVLPNLGPDWGVCLLPPAEGAAVPQVVAALAVKPGGGTEPVDAALLRALQQFAGLAVLDHNRKNPAAPIRIETVQQGKVAVRVLVGDKVFPAGVRPAAALKDGFLVLASSPEAIARFAPHDGPAAAKDEAPLLRVSPPALAAMLRARREPVLQGMRAKDHISAAEAERRLDQLLGLLELFESVTLSQHGEPGQASWTLRARPRAR